MPRLIFAKAFIMPLSAFRAVNRNIGIEESIDFTRAVQPAWLTNLPFRGFRRTTALSI
jgi:hypothetical protein